MLNLRDEFDSLRWEFNLVKVGQFGVRKLVVLEGLGFLWSHYEFFFSLFKSMPFSKEDPNLLMQHLQVLVGISKELA